MNSFEIAISVITFSQQIDNSWMAFGEGEQFVTEKYCILGVVKVQVLYHQFVYAIKDLVAEE